MANIQSINIIGSREGSRIFFFNDTATTEIYTLSLHDALPICFLRRERFAVWPRRRQRIINVHSLQNTGGQRDLLTDRKSTRLNSSHSQISYAVFCLKKKNYYPAYGERSK